MIIYTRRRVVELRAIRARLSNTNELLKESNNIKDEYITRFLTECSAYIDKLDSYLSRFIVLSLEISVRNYSIR